MAERIIVLGGPHCGKTTYALKLARERGLSAPRHTDDLIGKHDWSGCSAEVARWFDLPGPWLIEGVACARALRKWLASHPRGKPCDVIVPMHKVVTQQTGPQAAMHSGCLKVWNEVQAALLARGVLLEQPRRGASPRATAAR